ncbi:beta-kafirin [Panicum miliaceum]|uniref:Beta-kafirin n=1 Tax=Panicum miliaceum TaxID=4540 RepID=A0A3L6SXY4_PANMI|nr:beta-kafirin [Panicum miliaceum]
MKMFMVLAVLALAAAAASSAQQFGREWPQQGTYGAAAALYPCAEFLRQPQCSPVAAPFYVGRICGSRAPSASRCGTSAASSWG